MKKVFKWHSTTELARWNIYYATLFRRTLDLSVHSWQIVQCVTHCPLRMKSSSTSPSLDILQWKQVAVCSRGKGEKGYYNIVVVNNIVNIIVILC